MEGGGKVDSIEGKVQKSLTLIGIELVFAFVAPHIREGLFTCEHITPTLIGR